MRLFTFGCSFTQYWRWPTWADIVGRQYDAYENWGICGGGNASIFYNLIEANQRHRFDGATDQVMIMWTNTSREDHYVVNEWLGLGNIYWNAGSEYPKEYVHRFACERGFLIRDLALIAAARDLLQSWNVPFRFFSMVPLNVSNLQTGFGAEREADNHDVLDLYRTVLDSIAPSVYQTVFDSDWNSRPGIADVHDSARRDFHPTPMEHLEYLNVVAPDITIPDQHRVWAREIHTIIAQGGRNYDWHSRNLPRQRL